ncbi:hypothetical protein PM082_017234 [Marasmius tenuissimus]|nr:hypothetical protein PM082_017234 [Marasmius tenuissimus]
MKSDHVAHVSHLPPEVPDDVTLAHFMFQDGYLPSKPRDPNVSPPCLIEEKSGRAIKLEELQSRTVALACGLRAEYGIGESLEWFVFKDYPVLVWAVHYLRATVTLANPSSTVDELSYHIGLTRPALIIAHSASFQTARLCVRHSNYRESIGILLLGTASNDTPSIDDLILSHWESRVDPTFLDSIKPRKGLSKRVAALCLSSGTTGLPKVVRITHRSFITNIIQMVIHTRHEGRATPGLRPGDIALGLLPFYRRF